MLNHVADAFAGGEDSEDSTQSIAGSVEAAKAAIAGSSSGKNPPQKEKRLRRGFRIPDGSHDRPIPGRAG